MRDVVKRLPRSSAPLSEPSFLEAIRIERVRADRIGGEFALVVFETDVLLEQQGSAESLIRAMLRRKRAMDSVGWMSSTMIGILLPGANLEGGWRYALDLSARLKGKMEPPPFTVWAYPELWMRTGADSGNGSAMVLKGPQGGPSARASRKLDDIFLPRLPVWKRIMDVLGSVLGIALCLPAWAVMAVWIRIVSPGPILFRQERMGRGGCVFQFLKIRTMRVNNDEGAHRIHSTSLFKSDVPMDKLDDKGDSRIIPGGRIIRKLCLDESPQFINVLLGQMSLVGPRPCIPYEANEYSQWHRRRLDQTPGLTGLWQVSGKNRLTFREMVRLDIRYMLKISIGLDLSILLRTVPAILKMAFEARRKRFSAPGVESPGPDAPVPFDPCTSLLILAGSRSC